MRRLLSILLILIGLSTLLQRPADAATKKCGPTLAILATHGGTAGGGNVSNHRDQIYTAYDGKNNTVTILSNFTDDAGILIQTDVFFTKRKDGKWLANRTVFRDGKADPSETWTQDHIPLTSKTHLVNKLEWLPKVDNSWLQKKIQGMRQRWGIGEDDLQDALKAVKRSALGARQAPSDAEAMILAVDLAVIRKGTAVLENLCRAGASDWNLSDAEMFKLLTDPNGKIEATSTTAGQQDLAEIIGAFRELRKIGFEKEVSEQTEALAARFRR